MRPKYKQAKVVAPHCPSCGARLGGNNSMLTPWECDCGKWVAITYPFEGEYEIEPRRLPLDDTDERGIIS